MYQPSHQTVRLSAGRHPSPQSGACVMELASMLAGEPFTDHPRAVCPVIATVLRAYNDALDDDRRQDLYRYAAASVGTRSADRSARERRFELCREFFGLDVPRWRLPFSRLPMRALALAALRQGATATDASHKATLEFVDRLIAVSRADAAEPSLVPVANERSAPVA
jgi:hypothetical protein